MPTSQLPPGWLTGLLEHQRVPAYSVRETTLRLQEKLGSASPLQVSYLGEAGVFGEYFESAAGISYAQERVESRLKSKVWSLSNLHTVPDLAAVGSALILRQRPITPTDADAGDPRPFFGTHMRLVDSIDPAERQAVDNATRMYWPISERRRAQILHVISNHGYCPLVITIGKFCLGGRNITDLEEVAVGHYGEGRVAFTITDPGNWIEPLRHAWVESGGGPATAWWSL